MATFLIFSGGGADAVFAAFLTERQFYLYVIDLCGKKG